MVLLRKCLALTCVAGALLASGCTGMPEGVEPVQHFELSRYLGTWHEIARLDHSFERGLSRVTAEYSLREDGGVKVVNRGYDDATGLWKETEGKAYFTGSPTEGRLKVSFFGPFYGAYNILELDSKDYGYALVSGPDRSYLWILARSSHPDAAVVEALVARAAAMGFDTERLIYVRHD